MRKAMNSREVLICARYKILFGCRVSDYGDDDFEIVASVDRRRNMKKMWTKYNVVSSGDNSVIVCRH